MLKTPTHRNLPVHSLGHRDFKALQVIGFKTNLAMSLTNSTENRNDHTHDAPPGAHRPNGGVAKW